MITGFFYRVRLALLMLGYAWLIRLAAFINPLFRQRLGEIDFTFVMKSREETSARFFVCHHGKLRSSIRSRPVIFKLIWRDDRTGGGVMLKMLRGRPKALYHAVADGDLLLEGDAQTIGWYMKTSGRLEKVFRRSGGEKQ